MCGIMKTVKGVDWGDVEGKIQERRYKRKEIRERKENRQ